MMLLRDGPKSLVDFTRRVMCRYIRDIASMLAGVMLFVGVVLVMPGLDASGQGIAEAVDSPEQGDGRAQQLQAGLMGVLSGVASMEQYSDAVRLVDVADANEEVLVGVKGLDRRVLHRTAIEEGTKIAGELGYYAQQAVYENQMSQDDYNTLLQIVEAEATGGDMRSKMIVAQVVLNRVQDSHFPDTIYDVVWQKAQFQPTSDGRIYSCSITDSTVEAVDRVLQGEDYSQGALFFFAREDSDSASASWFDSSLVKIFEYGGHEYFTFEEYVSGT